jgi:xanthosine phosphorylase
MSDLERAADLIRDILPDLRAGLVLGSGLGAVAGRIEAVRVLSYAELPGFPRAAVEGHAGRMILGRFAGLPVACLQGRAHWYEGGPAAAMTTPLRALRHAGAGLVVLTNTAGSLREEVGVGRLMLVSDHINLIPANPLVGPNDEAVGPRFPSLRDAYDPGLRRTMRQAGARAGIPLAEGVYLAYPGPSFETAAEIRAFRTLGADAVGMSTAPETIVARHCGLRVCAVSVITNLAEGLGSETPTHEQTLAAASHAADDLGRLLDGFFGALARG